MNNFAYEQLISVIESNFLITQSLQAKRFQQQGTSAKSGIYIAKSLSSPELVNLKKYAHSIDKLQSNIGKAENVHAKSDNDLLQLRVSDVLYIYVSK